MRGVIAVSAVIAASAAVAACAMQPPGYGPRGAYGPHGIHGPRQCFYSGNVRGFREGPGDSIIINTSSRDYYTLQPYGPCPNINTRLSIGIQSYGGGNFLCTNDYAVLLVPGPLGAERCPVRTIRKLSPAEVTALHNSRRR
jgi:hypothetical protein